MNKKRQELSDQLKQISIKIDKEIHDLRKQNPNNGSGTYSASNSISKTRESIPATNSYVPITNRPKNQEGSVTSKSSSKDPFSSSK